MRKVLNPETARLIKADGSEHSLEVQFSTGSVMTFDVEHAIDEGDIFVRELPNGAVEEHEVVDASFSQQMGSIAANYQCSTKKRSPSRRRETRVPLAARGNCVFVVHGRDSQVRDALYRFLRVLGLKVMTWDDAVALGTGSQTNFEIVRQAIEAAGAVIILFTPDELVELRAGLKSEDEQPHLQPRANVLFEAGWAFGAHREKTIVVEAGMTHRVSDIDGFNNVRMRSGASLNTLASRLESAGCVVNRNDPAWMDVTKYPELFELRQSVEQIEGHEPASGFEGLDDDTLVEILRDKLPGAGFHTYRDLDRRAGLPDGTAKRLAARAARAVDRFESATEHGIRLGVYRVIRRA